MKEIDLSHIKTMMSDASTIAFDVLMILVFAWLFVYISIWFICLIAKCIREWKKIK